MELPEVGARIRAGVYATVMEIETPNAEGNLRLIVEDDRGRLGWIMYYPNRTGSEPPYFRSNVSFFLTDQAAAIRARLAASAGG